MQGINLSQVGVPPRAPSAEEIDVGFVGQPNVWARMNATAHATGDHLRAWVEVFTGTNSTASVTEIKPRWTVCSRRAPA